MGELIYFGQDNREEIEVAPGLTERVVIGFGGTGLGTSTFGSAIDLESLSQQVENQARKVKIRSYTALVVAEELAWDIEFTLKRDQI